MVRQIDSSPFSTPHIFSSFEMARLDSRLLLPSAPPPHPSRTFKFYFPLFLDNYSNESETKDNKIELRPEQQYY